MAAVLAAVVATALLTPSAVAQTTVGIPDDNLRAAVNEALGRASDSAAAVTAAQMASITDLIVPDTGITDVTGLAHATGLVNLDLSHNRIGGSLAAGVLKVSAFHDLVVLRAVGTGISEVTLPTSEHSSLQELYLGGRHSTDNLTGTLDVSARHELRIDSPWVLRRLQVLEQAWDLWMQNRAGRRLRGGIRLSRKSTLFGW